MAGKFGKRLAFFALAGAALAGVYYFFFREKDDPEESEPKESEIKNFFEEMPAREYVSLNREAGEEEEAAKEVLKDKIEESVKEKEEKEREKEEGVGLVKEDVNTSDFEFESLNDDEEEDI